MRREELETKKVEELKEESRKRGLTLEHKGHKFTKQELIERILKWDAEQADICYDILKSIEEAGEGTEETKCEDVKYSAECSKLPCEKTSQKVETKEGYRGIKFARTLEEIKQKYGDTKKQEVYDDCLKVGSLVVFVRKVTSLKGWTGEKLRTAKVIAVNRKKELVRVRTYFNDEFELSFSELLYIRKSKETSEDGVYYTYPKDIAVYLKEQRAEYNRAKKGQRYEGYSKES